MNYKDYDEWFSKNCRGCRNFFECVRENKIPVGLTSLEFPSCNRRKAEIY